MRILVFAWVVILVACVLQITHAGETKRKKLVLVVPEKVRHIHHHHVKKIYIKSKPHYHTSYEEGLHRGDSAGSFEEDDDVGAIKIKSHGHHKRHSGSRHEHKEESKKVVIHSGEVPWHEDKSIEIHHPSKYGDHDTAASIISKLTSKPTKSSSESSSDEEQRTIVFLDNDGTMMTESPRTRIKTIHHHHHHHEHGTKEQSTSQTNTNSESSRPSQQLAEPQQFQSQNVETSRPQILEPIRPQNLEPARPQILELVRQQNIEPIGSQNNINPALDRPPNHALDRPPKHALDRPLNHALERPPNHALERPPSRPFNSPNHIHHEPSRTPSHINHEPNRPHIQSGVKPLPRGKPTERPKGNSTFIENLVPPPVNQQSFTRVVHGSTGFSHGPSAGIRPSNQRPNTPLPKTITGPVPQSTPNRIAPSGNNGAKSSFFHHHNQPVHSWRKR